jgi:hypothetical protein
LLLDEVELVGRYSLQQRGRSYAELARWMGVPGAGAIPGVVCVAAITDDYEQAVLRDKNDTLLVGERLRARGDDDSLQVAANAESGMRVIERDSLQLFGPTVDALRQSSQRLREVYQRAYGWTPPDVADVDVTLTRSFRSYIRRWINEWDLRRLYPDAEIHIEEEETSHTLYEEDALLERETEEPA